MEASRLHDPFSTEQAAFLSCGIQSVAYTDRYIVVRGGPFALAGVVAYANAG